MNKLRIWGLLLGIMITLSGMKAQTYDSLWKQVETLEQKGLPKSAIAKVEEIYEKAKAEKKVSQMMKAYLTRMAYRGEIAPDSLKNDWRLLEQWAADAQTSLPDKAVLYSILGELQMQTDVDKGNACLLRSLENQTELANYPADKLVPLVKTEAISRLYFDNNLYDLLARRAIDLWSDNQWGSNRETVLQRISDTYQSLLDLYEQQGKRDAWLLTALDAHPDADEEQLRKWITIYADLEVCAEVYLRLSQRMGGEERAVERLACVREAVERYPRYRRISALKNVEKEILSPRLNGVVFSAYPDEPVRMKVNYRNLSGLVAQVYQLNLAPDSKEIQKVNEKTIRKYGSWLREEVVELSPTTDYRTVETQVSLRALPRGVYYLSLHGKGFPKEKEGAVVVVVSEMEIYRPLPDNQLETIVLDKRSGTPQGKEIISPEKERWMRYQYTENKQKQTLVQLFTDRALYRPGQTIQFSGLVYEQLGDSVKAVEGRNMKVLLLDTDGKEVGVQQVETDEWGAFGGTFALPDGGQTGNYRLETKGFVLPVHVEEYKRPVFEVVFDEVKTLYRAGDSLKLTGMAKTFSGAPVSNASVKFTVERMESSWWRRRGPVTHRVEGVTQTDAYGCFRLPVHLLSIEERQWASYTYIVKAEVTAETGETQAGTLELPVATSSYQVAIPSWKTVWVKEEPEAITFAVCNLMRQNVDAEVTCEVMQGEQTMRRFVVRSNTPMLPEALYQLPSGHYQLKVSVEDEEGKMNSQVYSFTLFSMSDTTLPDKTVKWGYQTSETFPATIYYGTGEKDVTLFYDVFSGNKHLERKQIACSDSLLRFPFEYKEEYGEGILVTFAFVKDSQLHTQSFTLRKPQPDKSLQLKWTSFRDRLLPGSQETWTLKVCHPDGKVARAQLMATLYDASLDAFLPHSWNFNVAFNRSLPFTFWRAKGNEDYRLNIYFPLNASSVNGLVYSALDLPFIAYRGVGGMKMYSARSVRNAYDISSSDSQTEIVFEEEIVPLNTGEEKVETELRSNFAETAFFYPNLQTDDRGEVSLSFTLPESFTTWKFMGLAHTRELDYGQISAQAVTAKEFMLQPNLPRFVRVGDEVSLSASLMNLSDRDVIGNVRMELFNPKNDRVYLVKKQRFLITPQASTTVHFGFVVSDKYEDLAVRWIAEGDRFSDGEQRVLPVLSNKQQLTESVPLYIHGQGTAVFSLESLFNHHSSSITHPRMTVEMAGNPGWYAVQALPVLANPENEDALSWATACYAHSLTNYLTEINPRLASLWNVDSLRQRAGVALFQLQELQRVDGSWSWYKGMEGSRFITTQTAELLARLYARVDEHFLDNQLLLMLKKTMGYLEREAKKEIEDIKKAEKQGVKNRCPSESLLHYLYLSVISQLPVDEVISEYVIGKLVRLEEWGQLTIYGKACSAIVLQHAGKKAKAKEFLQSVLEYSVYSDEMGRYFDTPRAEYTWKSYKIPTQVAVIEAFHWVASDKQTVEEMKRWLLQQKRVQDWDTPIATADAVYALLNIGENVLEDTGECELLLGKTTIRVSPSDTLAYVKQALDGKVTEIREVTVVKPSSGTSWGAVYAEYQEDMDLIGTQGNGLWVHKEILRNGQPLVTGASLKRGDRLTVCLTVKADRDMDFVEVKDERAACLEPVDVLSGYRWKDGVGYYQRTKDASTSFFIEQLRKGTYVLQYDVYVSFAGHFQGGAAIIRSVYAPEFNGHDGGASLVVVD